MGCAIILFEIIIQMTFSIQRDVIGLIPEVLKHLCDQILIAF